MSTPLQLKIESVTVSACGLTLRHLFTADECAAFHAYRLAGVVIHRINFPKAKDRKARGWQDIAAPRLSRRASLTAKSRPLLTETECREVRQSVAYVLTATGGLDRLMAGKRLDLGHWRAIFREVRGRDCLGIDRASKQHARGIGEAVIRLDAMPEGELEWTCHRAGLDAARLKRHRTEATNRRIRHHVACILASFRADTSRQRAHNKRRALQVLRWLVSQYSATGQGLADLIDSRGAEPLEALRMSMDRFAKLIARGDEILTTESLADAPQAVKPQRWEIRLKSLDDLPTLGGSRLTLPTA